MTFWKYSLFFFFSLTIAASASTEFVDTKRVYLSGQGKDDMVEWDFRVSAGQNSGEWSKIGVPSNWEPQGFGKYNYGFAKPVEGPSEDEDERAKEVGFYKRTFAVPGDWQGKRVWIVFEGVMTDTKVLVNGEQAGPVHQGGFYRFHYDISDKVNYGAENLLEVEVHKRSSNDSVENAERLADFWIFGGIYRPVYLQALPRTAIDWTAIDARADGSFLAEIYPLGAQPGDTLGAQVTDLEGNTVGGLMTATVGEDSPTTLTGKLEGIKTWSAEDPNLYEVEFRLLSGGELRHRTRERFGFRTIEVTEDQGLLVNGTPVVIRGINRHAHWPDSGRTTSAALSRSDAELIKSMNMNAVRMSHYPNDTHFYEVCDELGLYVIDELGGQHRMRVEAWKDFHGYETEIGERLVKAMLKKNVNHPSIIIWANGNEGGNNPELTDDFKKWDPQDRPVIEPMDSAGGFNTGHYPTFEQLTGSLGENRMPRMPTEFLHGLGDGGHGAGLDTYWNAILAAPNGVGGFLWVMNDEGIVRTDKNGEVDAQWNKAADGILGPYREKEGSYFTVKEIWSPVYIPLSEQQNLPEDFEGAIELRNRYDFRNLNTTKWTWRLVRFEGDEEKQLAEGTLPGPDVAPGQSGQLLLNLPDQITNADLLRLTGVDREGRELWTWDWRVSPRLRQEVVKPGPSVGRPSLRTEGEEIIVSAGDKHYHFSRATGRLLQATVGDDSISLSGPEVALSRYEFQEHETSWGGTRTTRQIERVDVDPDQSAGDFQSQETTDGVELTWLETLGLEGLRWTVRPDGALLLEASYETDGMFDFAGVTFSYPEEKMVTKQWLGNGPYRVWKNRLKGQNFGLWANDYNDTETGRNWDYPEFQGYFDAVHWMTLRTQEGAIRIILPEDDLYLGIGQVPITISRGNMDKPAPQGTINLLNAIPAIDTKGDPDFSLGPQSRPFEADGRHQVRAIFQFQ